MLSLAHILDDLLREGFEIVRIARCDNALIGEDFGIFLLSGALDFAKHLSQRVIMIDGNQLNELMIEHKVGVRVSRALEFKRLDEDFFTEED